MGPWNISEVSGGREELKKNSKTFPKLTYDLFWSSVPLFVFLGRDGLLCTHFPKMRRQAAPLPLPNSLVHINKFIF